MSPRKNVHERPKYVREYAFKSDLTGPWVYTNDSLSLLPERAILQHGSSSNSNDECVVYTFSLWLYPYTHTCVSIRNTRTKLAFRLLVALLPFPFFSLFLLSDRPPQSYTSVALAQPMRARRTPIQSYSGLGQVRRERQRVVSWSLVPRSGYGILTPSSGVWQAMAGPIDVSATSHPRHFAPLFTTRPLLLSSRFGTLLSGFPHPNHQTRPTTSRCPRPPTHRTKSRSCLLLPSLFTMAMRYPHYLGVVLHIRAT